MLIAAVDKIAVVPTMPVAMTARGDMREAGVIFRDFTVAFLAANSVDAGLVKLARSLPRHATLSTCRPYEIVMACFSESRGPEVWYFSTVDRNMPSIPARTLARYDGIGAAGSCLNASQVAALGVTAGSFTHGALEPGLALMEAWRSNRGTTLDGTQAGFCIGAHVDHAIVSAAGATVERVHRWPDKVGQLINPEVVS
ncbi:hypothetical protein [Devosia sp. 2618]|uniref:hypothetical protein n=1 Tax=Devosia sp. 2618 TaxID=3156454 RepID=UPI003395D32E